MDKPINLRQARKRRERAAKETAAAGNRARYGRTRPEKRHDEILAASRDRHIEGHRREMERDEDGNG